MYDVIVVGAGPAGCTAAKVLAEKGYHVLIVEKFKIPRYKSCSGILIRKSMELVKEYFGENTPESVMCTPIQNKGMIFTDDKGKEYRFEQDGLNVWRSHFDGWLAKKAEESGAKVRDNTAAFLCMEQDGFVEVHLHGEKNNIESAKYVLDCEGVIGALKRKIIKNISGHTAENSPGYITTFQTFNKGSIRLDSHYFYAYLQPELSEYDAWFNVKDELLVLGVSVKDTKKIKYYYERFIAYMETKHHLQIDKQIKSEKWLMPHIRPECHVDYGVGHILFAGEIAGFLNPMGEGISAGMESGYHAASAIADHFDNLEMIYKTYKQNTANMKTYMERQWNLVGRMADTFKEMAPQK